MRKCCYDANNKKSKSGIPRGGIFELGHVSIQVGLEIERQTFCFETFSSVETLSLVQVLCCVCIQFVSVPPCWRVSHCLFGNPILCHAWNYRLGRVSFPSGGQSILHL